MITKRNFLLFWLGGLLMFAIAIAFHLPLIITEVPDGIGAHQTAGDAATVDAIHAAWREAGVLDTAGTAMILDLIFIGLFGFGSLLGGLYYSRGAGVLRPIGGVLLLAAIVFTATDYLETILQYQQYAAMAGDDYKAAIAEAMQQPKVISWIACFLLPIAALLIEWRAGRAR